jgi:acetyl-CoA acyltransferase
VSVRIIGVAATPCGRFLEATVESLAVAALDAALDDAKIAPDEVSAIFFANALSGLLTGQECVRGQVALRRSRYGGIPTVNTDNACASGSTALHLAATAVAAGTYETVAVVGVEKMSHEDRSRPIKALQGAADVALLGAGSARHSVFMDSYAERARACVAKFAWSAADFARVVVKNRQHAAGNPGAQFRDPLTIEKVLASRMISEPLTLPMCSPIGDGAAALVVTGSRGRVRGAIRLRACAMSAIGAEGSGTVVQRASAMAREQSGISANEVQVIEIHDATASAELEAYEHLGLTAEGEGQLMIRDGRTMLGGDLPVNPSGGLLSRGHPVGATGVYQVVELVSQLRGQAVGRQVEPRPKLALAQNAGGFMEGDNAVAVVTVLEGD